jgi:hypothetical protein
VNIVYIYDECGVVGCEYMENSYLLVIVTVNASYRTVLLHRTNTYRIVSAHLQLETACRHDDRKVSLFTLLHSIFTKRRNNLNKYK